MAFEHGSEDDSEWGRGRYEEFPREICPGAVIGEPYRVGSTAFCCGNFWR